MSAVGWRRIPRGVWALGLVSLCMDLSSELVHALLPLYMATVLGASMLIIGLIEGVAEATALVVKVFSGVLSDCSRGASRWSSSATASGRSPSSSFRWRPRCRGSSVRASSTASARASAARRATH